MIYKGDLSAIFGNRLERLTEIHFRRFSKRAVIPSKSHPDDAGFDLTAHSKTWRGIGYAYGTGIAVNVPVGFVGLLFPRSSIRDKGAMLCNSVGVLDAGYIGEIVFTFRHFDGGIPYQIGDRIGQLVILPLPKVTLKEVVRFPKTQRGKNGLGSTGK